MVISTAVDVSSNTRTFQGNDLKFMDTQTEQVEDKQKMNNEVENSSPEKEHTHQKNELISFDTKYTYLKYRHHEETNEYFVQIVDQSSDEVLSEIPREQYLDILGGILKYFGTIVDQKI
ncbi:flagellar protein FlaG [Bacillus solimangrovi]|uniref:flagellar protein FlaG n=1 Tax=Bacillus solimangrovi TaxID=1305675 RepID=UPI001586B4A0|nr:flagellar protein FlaG [Bacillus solimangrovi]